MRSGEVSYVDRLTPQLTASLKGVDGVSVVETPSFQNLVALLNTASGPLADPNLRKAVAKAFDPAGIAAALGGSVTPAKGVIPPGLLGLLRLADRHRARPRGRQDSCSQPAATDPAASRST